MKHFSIIIGCFLALSTLLIGEAKGQLITDSEKRKLETRTAEPRDSRSFKRKSKSSSGPVFNGRVSRRPVSSASGVQTFKAFQKRAKETPKPSSSLAGRQELPSRGAMSASDIPFRNTSKRAANPRYSKGNQFEPGFFDLLFAGQPTPKSSEESPFRNKSYQISPKYSAGSPFKNKDYQIAPKYSAGSPFRNKDYQISPKYSTGSPYTGMNWDWIQPKYSTNKNRFDVNKRYEKQTRIYNLYTSGYKGESRRTSAWYAQFTTLFTANPTSKFLSNNNYYKSKPVASAGSTQTTPYKNARATSKWYANVNARMTSREMKNFLSRNDYYKGTLGASEGTQSVTPDYKQRWVKKGAMHPSAMYQNAFQDSEALRSSIRKWNVFWSRLDGNKEQPEAVKDRVLTPKFDRKEAEIWND